ncbi:hypothetical protein CH352_18705 [Leptospira hartskeerlii]|uniref:Uncharacterized protein n=1 Tax=Leptospira hartskeerlii TaxID=2023177 RepID=A0A2M9X889_9LEPT|nr:hypothetical protein [Leptospira hartskeerlii]PJZ23913.1 hypothetical protein CH357_18635 [Leptospira hartskeerlii]PJZ31939.1 hypothetical protein CH352_18705 [Leptospira hartskeerlii]
MFKNLTDFSYQRNWKEALIFYIVWLLIIVISSGLISGIGIGLLSIVGLKFLPDESFQLGAKIGNIVAVVGCLFISFIILKKKNLQTHIGFILVGLLAGLLAVFIGGFGGLIPCSYLSTLSIGKGSDQV